MKKTDIVRLVLSGVLLYFIWIGNMTAIKITLTLVMIGQEASGFLLRKIENAL